MALGCDRWDDLIVSLLWCDVENLKMRKRSEKSGRDQRGGGEGGGL